MSPLKAKRFLISVVVPCLNEEENIPVIHRRLQAVLGTLKHDHEIMFVDDGSSDRSWALMEKLCRLDRRAAAVKLSRNFGHQKALLAGLGKSQGDAVVIIDADLQDPPELIPELVAKWQQGYQVVYARRRRRAGESLFKRLTARIFYRLIHRVTDVSIPVDTGDFRLIDRRVVEVLLGLKEKNPFVRGLISWIGFRQIGVEYDRDQRLSGVTKYPLRRMVRFALDGITSFSGLPLKLATYCGFAAALVALATFIYSLAVWVFAKKTVVPGWTSLITAILFLGGIQLIAIGIIGEYIRRIYDETRDRPNFIIDRVIGRERPVPRRRQSGS